MKIGTRSLIHGIHAFWLHPWFVAWAWWKLYGFPCDIRLWVAFVIHDWGYYGKPNMDGKEGESHPILGARIMEYLFGAEWGDWTLRHSRHYAKVQGKRFSALCVADKLASCIYPRWLYIRLAKSTGELAEYRSPKPGREANEWITLIKDAGTDEEWFDCLNQFMTRWVEENRDKGDGVPNRLTKRQDVEIQSK